MAQRFIPVADFLAALPEIAAEGGIRALSERIAASGEMGFHAAERRLGSIARGEQQLVGVGLADRILVALDRPHTFPDLETDYVPPASTECEDCGQEIEPGVMPIDLFRHEPDALEGRVWNKTTGKWVRSKRARAGGRRFRPWHLCRFCRAEALRVRAHRGRKKTSDRSLPKRGGRPRLLSDDELRSAHWLYLKTGISRREIAKRLNAAREKGTQAGYEQSLLYGWRRLGLKLRPIGAQIAISVHGRGVDWQPHVKQRCTKKLRSGKRCQGWRWSGAGEDELLCWNHVMQERRKDPWS